MSIIQDHVTATELARNLSALEGVSASVLKTLLDKNPLTPAEKTAYAKDLDELRDAARLPPSPWES